MRQDSTHNIDYQAAKTRSGGSYTEGKLARLDIPPLAGKRFLDLGCNTGFYCRWALEQGAAHVVGVDNDPRVIEKARTQSSSTIIFRDTGWDDFPHGSYDVVILLSAIHYARSPRDVVRNIRRSLACDGMLVLEGGVLFMGENRSTDIPLPGWRRVGDRCLHLTQGFIRNHLLVDFDWAVKGPSEMRGGDDVPRYVVHARPSGAEKDDYVFTLDILDFFAAAKHSASTIVEGQPAHAYVAPLKDVSIPDAAYVSKVLSDDDIFDLFQTDLDFCLKAVNPSVLRVYDTLDPEIMSRVVAALARNTIVERIT
jgi:SAM-dependent methyltransferase